MKIKWIVVLAFLFSLNISNSQNNQLPYYEISEYPSEYNEGTVVARMIDGLGFRYYWATEGLRDEDLAFKPSEGGRTTSETIDHIYGLTKTIINSALKKPNMATEEAEMTFAEKRAKTLNLLKQAADIFRKSDDLSEFTMVFVRGENTTEYPFWNQINGPISDALWHVGQVITHRRTSGNPFNSKVSVLQGKVRD
ncbi:hypothetical protein [Pontimicrobium aquaticum]|uniref:DinB superfamily protein n=1 Tax=Pontimicrobium aquaticum TaxID=2565367 RepID=A0A4U0EX30_9FLAO|nr:hypothetical protein [Pontimicrobium aquaticum]TJY36420.1 hypothetical protein E5167_07090 [Pontimicrobium aquaticum]